MAKTLTSSSPRSWWIVDEHASFKMRLLHYMQLSIRIRKF